jgi:hypothetical protein
MLSRLLTQWAGAGSVRSIETRFAAMLPVKASLHCEGVIEAVEATEGGSLVTVKLVATQADALARGDVSGLVTATKGASLVLPDADVDAASHVSPLVGDRLPALFDHAHRDVPHYGCVAVTCQDGVAPARRVSAAGAPSRVGLQRLRNRVPQHLAGAPLIGARGGAQP